MGVFLLDDSRLTAAWEITRPYPGITHEVRSESVPRSVNLHVVQVDLRTPGLRFKLTPPGGKWDTVRQTTLDFLNQEQAQVAINAHFYLPFGTPEPHAQLVGLAVSEGRLYSGFEPQPILPGWLDQSHAIVPFAPAINLDPSNRVALVHRDEAFPDNRHVREPVTLWNAFSGSAQIVRDGQPVIPTYSGPPGGLQPRNGYSDTYSWYNLPRARTAAGFTRDGSMLVLFTVDQYGASQGLTVGEVAAWLIRDYGVWQALNLDGGPSTTLALRDPVSGRGAVVNASGDDPVSGGLGSNLAIFVPPWVDPAVRLTVASAPRGQVRLSWPAPAPGWVLEEAEDLRLGAWRTAEAMPAREGDQHQVLLSPASGRKFYRLRR